MCHCTVIVMAIGMASVSGMFVVMGMVVIVIVVVSVFYGDG